MTKTNARYLLQTRPESNDVYGWNGWVLDLVTRVRHPLIKTVLDYELHGEKGYVDCAFDTKAELAAAAQRKVNQLARAGH